MVENLYIKRVLQSIFGLLVVVAAAGHLYFTWMDDGGRVLKTLKAWEVDGPYNTLFGKARVCLSTLWWLGPLRPDAPRNPLTECKIPSSNGWWRSIVVMAGARGRLDCLTRQMQLAHDEQKQFMMSCLSTFFLSLYRLYNVYYYVACVFAILRFWWNRVKMVEEVVENEDLVSHHRADDVNKELQDSHRKTFTVSLGPDLSLTILLNGKSAVLTDDDAKTLQRILAKELSIHKEMFNQKLSADT